MKKYDIDEESSLKQLNWNAANTGISNHRAENEKKKEKKKVALACISWSQLPLTLKCCEFYMKSWFEITFTVVCQNLCAPARTGIKELEAWQRSSCWSFTWQPLRNPRDRVAQITLNLRKAVRSLKPVIQKWHEHTSKALAQYIHEVSAKSTTEKECQDSQEPGRQPLMGLWEQRPGETKAKPK